MSLMKPALGTITIFLLLISTTHAVPTKSQHVSQASQFLAPHNVARLALRLRPLLWDAKLARYAQWYANQRRFDCALEHSDGPYGENIFWGSGNDWTPSQAVADWVSERQWYDYWSNSCAGGEQCGHYTQIVWSSTRRVGCARVKCLGDRGVFMTCNYDPPGNYIGERP
ncbi:pathogenesis-related protein PR-1-like [Corylus avellana]|uniref:pathogenesis-related protein PR-1-like n=1 Tax=Corylus avellana TaxID=13451 RepID=UPI00286A42B4|nr:pathogenesis-related protein PR-1-like [Corylus avellana]